MLHQSGLEARSVAAFLHENALEFVTHDGIDSAADILAYLSDAGMHKIAQSNLVRAKCPLFSLILRKHRAASYSLTAVSPMLHLDLPDSMLKDLFDDNMTVLVNLLCGLFDEFTAQQRLLCSMRN